MPLSSTFVDADSEVKLYELSATPTASRSVADLILIALVAGGDYDTVRFGSPRQRQDFPLTVDTSQTGIDGCGIVIAEGLVRYGLGPRLCQAVETLHGDALDDALTMWRHDLRLFIRQDPDKHIGHRYPSVAGKIPDTFPNLDVLKNYMHPITSSVASLPSLPERPNFPDVGGIAHFLEEAHVFENTDNFLKMSRKDMWPVLARRELMMRADARIHEEAFVRLRLRLITLQD